MPRRKKKVKEASESQNLEKRDEETSTSVSLRRKRKFDDAFIVISDSDGEVPKEENGLQKMTTEQPNREKSLPKRKIAQMTEEEQFALALRMSEQEAREVNSQEEEEEELLRKAIAESLNSCRPPDVSATSSPPLVIGPTPQSHQEKTTDSGITEGIWQLAPPSLLKGSHISQGNQAEEREEPWDHIEHTEEEPVFDSSGSGDQSNQPFFENKNIKCFDTCTGHLAEHTRCGTLHESTGRGCAFLQTSQCRGDTSRHCLPTPADASSFQGIGGTVHYYWGIPFCPAGVDPNQYTKVILCQLEVYQKSLKMAQRHLLKKKGFGEPVLPRPPLIKKERGRGGQGSERSEGISEDMGDEDKEERQEESRASVWLSKPKDFQESPIKSFKEKFLLEEEPTTSHGQSSQGLFVKETSEEENSVPASQSIATLTSKRSSVVMPESSAEEITVCPETQLSSSETPELEREVSPPGREALDEIREIMADQEVGNREDTGKEISTSAFSSCTKVSCPLCNQGYPPAKIERHAMYCNGLMEQDTAGLEEDIQVRSVAGAESGPLRALSSPTAAAGLVTITPREEPQLPQPAPVTITKRGQTEGRLLTLLEQSEHQSADAEIKNTSSETGSLRVPSPGVEEANYSREVQSSLEHLDRNNSPIKSFVSISEATDCLVDFKNQFTAGPGSRARTNAGRGRRRKR
ncbi:PREDICTED: BRCA1-A complex subunit RAP80 [Elephantulus edwardii]|uniref:BRCA1-A complex subunit RAP80 n=1 Tax=Elephantulus edwardii TaxID=28737 RepID=UPI0003F0594B|nr:PREDICTED: BRCA1-A complex subunit RAP80 [Elephantulus edwardii]